MREILVDYARQHRAAKRDGGERVTLDGLPFKSRSVDVLPSTTPCESWHGLILSSAVSWNFDFSRGSRSQKFRMPSAFRP
jgi:hypothetical protein